MNLEASGVRYPNEYTFTTAEAVTAMAELAWERLGNLYSRLSPDQKRALVVGTAVTAAFLMRESVRPGRSRLAKIVTESMGGGLAGFSFTSAIRLGLRELDRGSLNAHVK